MLRAALVQLDGPFPGILGRSRRLTLQAVAFEDILRGCSTSGASITAAAYKGVPLSTLSTSARGHVLADLGRRVDGEIHPDSAIADAIPGRCSNGKSRGPGSAAYDWLRDGLRIECKSAMMTWDSFGRCWKMSFSNVKIAYKDVRNEDAFDELLLALYTPRQIYFYRHDGTYGVGAAGCRTHSEGHRIVFYSNQQFENWSAALDTMLSKLHARTNGCSCLAVVPFTDPRIEAILNLRSNTTHNIFNGIPLAEVSGSERGKRIEALVRGVDSLLHPNSDIQLPGFTGCADGMCRRTASRAAFDWHRDGVRVECKSAQLCWDKHLRRWRLEFMGVKIRRPVLFDELLLGIYTPRGIYIYRHDMEFGLSTRGLATSHAGHKIQIFGPRGEADWSISLDAILNKLEDSRCKQVALVQW